MLLLAFLGTIVGASSAEPVGEFSRAIEINGETISFYEKFELKRNFSQGAIFSYEPWVSQNFSGTLTDYSLTVNGEEIDTDDYIRQSYSEETINLTEKGEYWEREITYPGYVDCFAEKISYSPVDPFPFKVCKFWTTNPPLPSVEWTTTVKLPKRYNIRDFADFSYRNFTLKPYSDEYEINGTKKEFVICDVQKGDIVTKGPQQSTTPEGSKKYIFGPYHFSQEFDYANYTRCDMVKTGSVKTGSMLRFSYGPSIIYKAAFAGAILLSTIVLFAARQTDSSNWGIAGVATVLGVQHSIAFQIGRPFEPTLYDLTILLALVPVYWYWREEREGEILNVGDEGLLGCLRDKM